MSMARKLLPPGFVDDCIDVCAHPVSNIPAETAAVFPANCRKSRRVIVEVWRFIVLLHSLVNDRANVLHRRQFQQRPRVAVQHRFALAFGAIHLLDFFHRHPISQRIGIIRSDQDMIRADYAFKILDGIYPIYQVVKIEILEITARRLRSGERLSSAAAFESLVKTTKVVRKKTASMEQPELEFGKPVENSA